MSNEFEAVQSAAFENSLKHGFWKEINPSVIPEKLCLIHSEVSEALETYREYETEVDLQVSKLDEKGKPIGFPSELADIVIRTMDLSGALGIDLWTEINRKMAYNLSRPFKHNKRI